MHLTYTDEQRRLQAELRDYFVRLMTPERRAALSTTSGEYGSGDTYRDIVRQLGTDGWLALGWPAEYGGRDRPLLDQLIFTDEAARAGVPVPFLTINSVAPTIMAFGSDSQKRRFLPRIAAGESHFSIGYSEPEAGTDLAALRTTAVREPGPSGDVYRINGQKMWTSLIAYADYVWLAARTHPTAPPHEGITIFAVPTDSAGFSWTPVHTMAGPDTSATYYQDVVVPASARIGVENGGWPLMTNQLNHERVALTSAAPLQESLRAVTQWARTTPGISGGHVIDSEWVRLHLARVHAGTEYLKLRNWEVAADAAPVPQKVAASATKVFGTEFATEAYGLLREVLGAAGTLRTHSPGAVLAGRLERLHRTSLILTFGGGANEVQRDIIARAGLGVTAR